MRQRTPLRLIGGSLAFLALGLAVTVGIPALEGPPPSAQAVPYSQVQLQGRSIYIREGCWYCHTQQVRPIEVEPGTVRVRGDLGPASRPGDYAYQKPPLWGTNRQGPDLTYTSRRAYGTKEWHIRHLKEPRKTILGSIMPSFAHLPEEELDALAEYLLTLR
ncbi:MAG: cbb3-type cytochrome c oxidase subunit II [Chloroflexi bacterium]|nr:cbb3-type cytochrome c oxidase subunit II [Chloroflexota bacterium]